MAGCAGTPRFGGKPPPAGVARASHAIHGVRPLKKIERRSCATNGEASMLVMLRRSRMCSRLGVPGNRNPRRAHQMVAKPYGRMLNLLLGRALFARLLTPTVTGRTARHAPPRRRRSSRRRSELRVARGGRRPHRCVAPLVHGAAASAAGLSLLPRLQLLLVVAPFLPARPWWTWKPRRPARRTKWDGEVRCLGVPDPIAWLAGVSDAALMDVLQRASR